MSAKSELIKEIETLPNACVSEVIDFIGYVKQRHLKKLAETMLYSERSLANNWNSKEEDEAWADL